MTRYNICARRLVLGVLFISGAFVASTPGCNSDDSSCKTATTEGTQGTASCKKCFADCTNDDECFGEDQKCMALTGQGMSGTKKVCLPSQCASCKYTSGCASGVTEGKAICTFDKCRE